MDASLIVPPLIVPVLIVGEVNVLLVNVSARPVVAIVDVALGNVNVASAANVGAVKLALFVPSPLASYISTAAAFAPFLTLMLELNTGVDAVSYTHLTLPTNREV